MVIVPIAAPAPVPVISGFDFMTVDAARRRVYAAHSGSKALLIVDADTGAILGQVKVGPMAGVAVDPASGHVFTGDGDSSSVSEVDPQTLKVVRSLDLPGAVDAVMYDTARKRIYADEDNGTRMWVIDAATMKLITTITLPGHKPEYLAVDPETHDVYQNIDDAGEFVIIDANALTVRKTIPTPGITHDHPLQYDATYKEIITGGGGTLAAYDRDGKELGHATIPVVDQCDLDQSTHLIACAGGGYITVLRTRQGAAPELVAQLAVEKTVHTLAIDGKTHDIWAVWPTANGDFVQRFRVQ
jgi:hypothetical protein